MLDETPTKNLKKQKIYKYNFLGNLKKKKKKERKRKSKVKKKKKKKIAAGFEPKALTQHVKKL